MLRRADPTIPPAEYPELSYDQARALLEDLDGHPGAGQVTEVPVPGGRAAQGQPARGGARTAGAGPAGTRSRLRGGHPGGHHRVPPAGSSALLRRGGAGACVQSDRRAPAPCSAPGRWRCPWTAGRSDAGGPASRGRSRPPRRPGRLGALPGQRQLGHQQRAGQPGRDGHQTSSSSPDSTASGASSQRRCGWGRPTGTCATAGTGGGHPRAGLRQRPPRRGTARHRLGRPGRRSPTCRETRRRDHVRAATLRQGSRAGSLLLRVVPRVVCRCPHSCPHIPGR